MNIKITFENMPHSDALEADVREKLKRVEQLASYDEPPCFIDVWLKAHKLHAHHGVELNVKTAHCDLHTHKEGPQMYQIVDEAIDTMVTLLKKHREKQCDRNQKKETEKDRFASDKYTLGD